MLKGTLHRSFPLWHAAHPLWLCGFRPFFLLAALTAPLCIGLWVAFLATGLALPEVAGGPFIWHAHELIFGFGLAAVVGFVLTGIPEFTDTAAFGGGAVRWLVGLWLLGRFMFWCSGVFGPGALLLAALAQLGLLGLLAAMLAPRLWRDPERRHLAFLWGLGALMVCVAGFYADALRGAYPGRWLHAALGALMVLIVVAMSRISMRIVNGAIDEAGVVGVQYRARPPRRNLAMVFIALYTVAEFWGPGDRIAGWLALAAAAAVLHLLNDWHIGRALFRRWALMLYGVYVLMAAGYATMGLALLLGGEAFSAGRHLLTVGALGLNIFVVMCIAGRAHCGLVPDERRWVPVGASMLLVAALVRAGAAWPGTDSRPWLMVSGVLWGGAFVLYAWHMAPVFWSQRSDGGGGCDGVQVSVLLSK
ncbi:MAG: NnrS family protein [Rhodoferax sp.]|nr:NnrS family protein [Rhodoferax sp.]MDP3653683.1 NnrS family protein [Rhodoferax sp.]